MTSAIGRQVRQLIAATPPFPYRPSIIARRVAPASPGHAFNKVVSLQARVLIRFAVVVTGGLLLGWQVLAATMDRIFAFQSPALALFWRPASADANAQLADQLLQAAPTARDRHIVDQATVSMTRQPINPAAARLLGVVAAQRGDEPRAARLLRYSEAMSRRDVTTQLILIESNVARGNVDAALLHYNRALNGSDGARGLLLPVLAQAANNEAVWRPLTRILMTRPQWGRQFLEQFVPVGTSPDALYTVAHALRMDQRRSTDPWMLQGIEKRLVVLGAYAQSAALYNRAHGRPANDRTPLRNGGFEEPGSADPFDWNLMDEQDLAATPQPSPVPGDGLALFLSALNGRGGEMASQLTMLPPGHYAIDATIGGVQGDPLAFPQLVVRCARDGREFLQASFPATPDSGRRWRLAVTIPADCAAERIILRGASTLDARPASPWIDNIAIRRQDIR